jgi:hypothetical protein
MCTSWGRQVEFARFLHYRGILILPFHILFCGSKSWSLYSKGEGWNEAILLMADAHTTHTQHVNTHNLEFLYRKYRSSSSIYLFNHLFLSVLTHCIYFTLWVIMQNCIIHCIDNSFFPFFLFLLFSETSVSTQDLILASQVLYHLSHSASPFF